MVLVFLASALTVMSIVTLIGGAHALPLALFAISVLAAIVIGFRAIVRWLIGEPPVHT